MHIRSAAPAATPPHPLQRTHGSVGRHFRGTRRHQRAVRLPVHVVARCVRCSAASFHGALAAAPAAGSVRGGGRGRSRGGRRLACRQARMIGLNVGGWEEPW